MQEYATTIARSKLVKQYFCNTNTVNYDDSVKPLWHFAYSVYRIEHLSAQSRKIR